MLAHAIRGGYGRAKSGMSKQRKTPPTKLKAAGKAYWRLVHAGFELDDTDETLLVLASEMLDRADGARQAIEKDGLTMTDRFDQVKPHPLIEVERQSLLAFVRIRRELGLDVDPPADTRLRHYLRGTR